MGLFSAFGSIGGLVGSFFGGSSSGGGGSYRSNNRSNNRNDNRNNNTSSRERVTVVENKGAVEAARLENERVGLVKKAQLEIIEAQKQAQILAEEAKAKGFNVMAQTMVIFQERMNDLALKRLEIIEHASVDVVQDIENFYREMAERIMKEDEIYNTQKLPQLMEILNSYEEGTGAYNLYFKRIDDDMAHHVYYIQQQMESVARRQEEVIRGFMDSKQKILEQTGSMTEKMLKEILAGQMALNAGAAGKTEAVKAVEAVDKKLLAEASGSK